jgi:hypothetical protein
VRSVGLRPAPDGDAPPAALPSPRAAALAGAPLERSPPHPPHPAQPVSATVATATAQSAIARLLAMSESREAPEPGEAPGRRLAEPEAVAGPGEPRRGSGAALRDRLVIGAGT